MSARVHECSCSLVHQNRKRVLHKSRELRDQLHRHFDLSNTPVWIAIQNRGEFDEDQYWIGKALGIKKVHTDRGTIGRNRYDPGDVEFAVRWYDRDVCGGDERRIFRVENHGVEGDSFNSTELRAINIPMQKVSLVGEVPLDVVALRLPTRAATRKHPHVRSALHEQRADPPQLLWEILPGDERCILDWCI